MQKQYLLYKIYLLLSGNLIFHQYLVYYYNCLKNVHIYIKFLEGRFHKHPYLILIVYHLNIKMILLIN